MEFMKKIEEISKKVGNAATDTYNTVADKSGKLIEEGKLKKSICDKEEEIEEIYMTIGKTVYDSYLNGEDVGKVFSKEAKKVDKLIAEIEDMNNKVLYNKGLRKCSNCNDTIDLKSTFCQSCGVKQKPIKLKEEKKEEKVESEEIIDRVCPQCGLVSEGKAKFCKKCGYQF